MRVGKGKMHEAIGKMEFSIDGTHGKMPFTIAIEGPDGTAIPLIKKRSRLPVAKNQVFTTMGSFQMSTYLHLVIGERDFVKDNKTLCIIRHDQGSFRMAGKARYRLEIQVTVDGRIVVTSENLEKSDGGKSACILYSQAVISPDEIMAIQEASDKYGAEDLIVRERFEFMSRVRDEMDVLDSDFWRLAKKKMTWGERSEYRKLRKKIRELIGKGPSDVGDNFVLLQRLSEEDIPRMRNLLISRSESAKKVFR